MCKATDCSLELYAYMLMIGHSVLSETEQQHVMNSLFRVSMVLAVSVCSHSHFLRICTIIGAFPDSKVLGANTGPVWG